MQVKAVYSLLRVALKGRRGAITELPSFVSEETERFEVLIKSEIIATVCNSLLILLIKKRRG